jgi:hypothetical protein
MTIYTDICLYEGNVYTRTVDSGSTRVDTCHVLASFTHEEEANDFLNVLLANGVIDENNSIL